MAFSSPARDQHLKIRPVSQLYTQPMASPVNASRLPSRTAAHHSGPKPLAKRYSVKDFHLLSFASLSWHSPGWVRPRHKGGYTPRRLLDRKAVIRGRQSCLRPVSPAALEATAPSAAMVLRAVRRRRHLLKYPARTGKGAAECIALDSTAYELRQPSRNCTALVNNEF